METNLSAIPMTEQRLTLQEWARLFGSRRSEKKAAASRENGRKGGRPRKRAIADIVEQLREEQRQDASAVA